MGKYNSYHVCQTKDCGYKSSSFLGKCPVCKKYGTLKEILEQKKSTPSQENSNRVSSNDLSVLKLKDVQTLGTKCKLRTGLKEFDRVVGDGITTGSVNVITAPPGCGKSTLLLDVSNNIASDGKKVIYISGEESESQIKQRANRTLDSLSDNFYIKAETNVENIIRIIRNTTPEFIVIDSVQMLYSNDIEGVLGGEKQLMHCVTALLKEAKYSKNIFSIFFVGQVTKEIEARGSMEFLHILDGIFTLENADDLGVLRILRSTKNRFGDTSEVGLFEMLATGMKELSNPNEYFISQRSKPVSGSCITAIKEGSRTIAIEINSLTETNNFSYPSRISQGVNKEYLQILLAILNNKGVCETKKKDVYVQTSNGVKVKDSCVGLAIAASILSVINNIPVPSDIAFLGEVSLTGEIKRVPNIDIILKDFERLGFKKVVVPKGNARNSYKHLKIKEISNITQLPTVF